MKRFVWLDVFKGGGILFIVLGHVVGAGSHLATGTTQAFCEGAYKYFYAFHVPLFFVAAGMTFRQRSWGDFLKGKFCRLLVPYFVFGLVSIFLYACLQSLSETVLKGHDTTGYYAGKTDALPLGVTFLNLFLGGWWPLGFAANSVLWFIPALFSVELVAQGISRGLRDCRGAWLLVAFLFWVVDALGPLPRLPWALALVPKYLPYFIIGMLMGVREISGPCLLRVVGAVVLIGFFLVGAVLNPWQYFPRTVWQHAYTTLLTLGNIAGWWLLSQTLPWRAVAFCGVSSLGIMLMHKFPVLFAQNFLAPVRNLFTGSIPLAVAGTAGVTLFAVGMCFVAQMVIARWMPWALGMRHQSVGAGGDRDRE